MNTAETRALLRRLFDAAVAAAHPTNCLPPFLPEPPARGRLILLAAGKAAGSMAEVAEQFYLDRHKLPADRFAGIAITRTGYGRPTRIVEMLEAGHPVPDEAGRQATERVLALADSAREGDLVLVLFSGGASANWIAPAPGLTLDDKRALTRALLRSGANIGEINTVRKHLSRIKGGRLAVRAAPARMVTLAISDVPGDDPSIIGSGPTVSDTSTLADSLEILARRKIELSTAIADALHNPVNETPDPGHPAFANSSFRIIARTADMVAAAAKVAREAGFEPQVLGTDIEGEARNVAREHADAARRAALMDRRAVLLSGGELTVTIKGQGRGGSNQEYALALAIALAGAPGVAAVAGDTDGTDGGGGSADDPAGAFIDETTLSRAQALGLDPARFLDDNDSTGFFEKLGDLLSPGPTCTNVNDLRAILVDTRGTDGEK
jgi:hydroxypyruvate reductase